MTYLQTSGTLSAAFALAMLALTTSPASATTRVAITPFDGPGELARQAHSAVVTIVASRHKVVSSVEVLRASAEAGGDVRLPRAARSVGRITGADALIVGRVAPLAEGFELAIAVSDAKSGRSVGAVLVPLFSPILVSGDEERIRPLVLNLIAQVAPSSAEVELATAIAPANELTSAPVSLRQPLPIVFRSSLGINVTRRRLRFIENAGADSGAGISGRPSAGVRIDGELTTRGRTRGGVAFHLDRAVGASIHLRSNGDTLELPIRQQRWALAMVGATDWRRAEFSVSAGYSANSVSIPLRPSQLRIPDTYYGSLSVGAGTRVGFRNHAFALYFSGRYLHVVATRGITSRATFGTARVRGLDTDVGFDLALTSRIRARLGLRLSRFHVFFDGNGREASELDDDPEQDVSGAVDSIAGFYSQLAFEL